MHQWHASVTRKYKQQTYSSYALNSREKIYPKSGSFLNLFMADQRRCKYETVNLQAIYLK